MGMFRWKLIVNEVAPIKKENRIMYGNHSYFSLTTNQILHIKICKVSSLQIWNQVYDLAKPIEKSYVGMRGYKSKRNVDPSEKSFCFNHIDIHIDIISIDLWVQTPPILDVFYGIVNSIDFE